MKRNAFTMLVPMLLMTVTGSAMAVDVDVRSSSPVTEVTSEDFTTPVRSVEDLVRLLPRQEVGVNVFYQDVHALQPRGGGGSPLFVDGGSVVGLGGQYSFRPNPNSGFYYRATGGYGIGSYKEELGGAFSFTDKVSFKSLYGSASAGLILPISKRGGVYAQGGAFYSSTTATYDDGTTEEDGEPFKVFGLDTAVGVRYNVGSKNSLFFEQYSQYGWGSGEDGDAKYNETVKYGCFRGGMNFGL